MHFSGIVETILKIFKFSQLLSVAIKRILSLEIVQSRLLMLNVAIGYLRSKSLPNTKRTIRTNDFSTAQKRTEQSSLILRRVIII